MNFFDNKGMTEEELQMAYLDNAVNEVVRLVENKNFDISNTTLIGVMNAKIIDNSKDDFYEIQKSPEYEGVQNAFYNLKHNAAAGQNTTKEQLVKGLRTVFPKNDNLAVDEVVKNTFSEAVSKLTFGKFDSVGFSSYSNVVRAMKGLDVQVYDALHDFQVANKNWSDPAVVYNKLNEIREVYVDKKQPMLLD